MMPGKIEDIKEDDLQRLKENAVMEGKTIEYKEQLPGNTDSEKKEFLADVSSFANASGGDLIYGVKEDKGIPEEISGIDIDNIDELKQRLDNMIRDGIKARIPSVAIQPVSLANGKSVIIVRILKSWISPHRVEFGGHHKFYSRNSNGKYELDVDELRDIFTSSDSITERMRLFVKERIFKIHSGETPIPLCEGPKVIVHLIPMASFTESRQYDIKPIASKPLQMKSINFHHSADHRYNLEGFIFYSGPPDSIDSYVQLYRKGLIEAVDSTLIYPFDDRKIINTQHFEIYIVGGTERLLKVLQKIGVEPPVYIFITLLEVKEYGIDISGTAFRTCMMGGVPINKNVFLLPEIMLHDYKENYAQILKPCFDIMWNACGFPASGNFDKDGKWKLQKDLTQLIKQNRI